MVIKRHIGLSKAIFDKNLHIYFFALEVRTAL